MSDEIWAEIPGFKDYLASTKGQIGSIKNGHFKVISQRSHNKGYNRVDLWYENQSKYYLVHKLVTLAFYGKRPKNKEVNHINTNKKDNRLENLEYVTKKENMQHAFRNGLYDKNIGEESNLAKLSNKNVKRIKQLLLENNSPKKISKMYNVHYATIGAIKAGRIWKWLD